MKPSNPKHYASHPQRRAGALFSLLVGAAAMVASPGATAADIQATLYPSQTSSNTVSATVPSLPPRADVLFSFDCTSSMIQVLDTAKADALRLMASLEATGVDFQYAVSSFMDYPNVFGNCGYSTTIPGYGDIPYGSPTDYPYLLSQGMTADTSAVSRGINSLVIGEGMDGPESYTRALYESYADPNMMWRTGAKRVVVNFGDSVPHDCNLNEGIPGTSSVLTTGGDPGRDGILDTGDDLDLQTVLSEMASNHMTLLAARCVKYGSDYYLPYWANWTARTGGKAFQTGSTTLIRDLMTEITNSLTITCVSNLHLVVEPPSFTNWVTAAPWTFDSVSSGDTARFDLGFTVPVGTTEGDYTFTLRVVDNAEVEYTEKSVTIHVLPTVPLPIALNNSRVPWGAVPDGLWFGQPDVSHDNVASALAEQRASLNTTVTGPGTVSFWWRLSSQTNLDTLTFTTGGSVEAQIAGETGWQPHLVYLPAGLQALAWTFAPDGGLGTSRAWVDEVTYVSGGTPPFFTMQPTNQVSVGGSPAVFFAAAKGTPALAYQWCFSGADIPGATASSFTITNPQKINAGTYSVRVSNAYGSTNSVEASLLFMPLIVQGDDSLGQSGICIGATNAVMVAAGTWHTVVLRADGKVIAWGNDSDKQCSAPTNLADVVQIAAGGYHSLALQANGTVVGWGANYTGQASPPPGLKSVVAISAGTWHSLALKADGTVAAWGDNSFGQLKVPAGLNNVIAIAAGGNHNLALLSNHTVVAWGENTDSLGGYLGQSAVPWGLNNVKAISAGEYHSLVVKADGTVVAWGDDSEGQCQAPPGLSNVVAVAGGGSHSLALKSDGTVVGWGNNFNGQAYFSTNILNVAAMAAGSAHSVLLIGLAPPKLLIPSAVGGRFGTLIASYPGRSYALQYKTSMDSTTWKDAITATGTGAPLWLADPSASDPCRFYRVMLR